MKVFISHSSLEKWIARKISEDLIRLGAVTFLDEKDIATGQSIDESIQDHLADSDDLLILLSPSSLKSPWVLIELGGALALKKNIIVILLFIGPNDVPAPITRYLARDINDVEKYYAELRVRMDRQPQPPATRPAPARIMVPEQQTASITPGMQVKIVRRESSLSRPELGWDTAMENYIGQTVTVTKSDSTKRAFKVKEDGERFVWAYEWAIPLNGK